MVPSHSFFWNCSAAGLLQPGMWGDWVHDWILLRKGVHISFWEPAALNYGPELWFCYLIPLSEDVIHRAYCSTSKLYVFQLFFIFNDLSYVFSELSELSGEDDEKCSNIDGKEDQEAADGLVTARPSIANGGDDGSSVDLETPALTCDEPPSSSSYASAVANIPCPTISPHSKSTPLVSNFIGTWSFSFNIGDSVPPRRFTLAGLEKESKQLDENRPKYILANRETKWTWPPNLIWLRKIGRASSN